jgi:hypothetical protein
MSGGNFLLFFPISLLYEGGKSRQRERINNSFKRDKLFLDDLLLINFILNVNNETNDQLLPSHLHATDTYSSFPCTAAVLAFRIQNTIKVMTKT